MGDSPCPEDQDVGKSGPTVETNSETKSDNAQITVLPNNNPFISSEDYAAELEDLTRDVAALNDRQDIVELNDEIRKLRKIIEEYDDRLATLVSSQEEALKMQDEEIERIRNSNSMQGTSSKTTETNLNFDEIFCMKRKLSGKNLLDNVNLTKCEGPSCTATNVDMIKCIRCHKFVCEECNDIPVIIYFKCKSCNDEDKGASSIPVISNNDSSTEPTPQNETPSQVPNKRQNVDEIIDRKFEELENKFNKNLSEKLAREFEKLNEKLTKIPDKIEQKYESFKDVVAGNVNTPASATNFKQIRKK